MHTPNPRMLFSLVASAGVLLAIGCARGTAGTKSPQTATAVASATVGSGIATAAAATATAVISPTAGSTPISGASFTVGTWTVVADRFRAQVNQSDGVNIRSTPEVKPDNRTGSLPGGATVEVEGRVDMGQEAIAGQGTTWYYLGTAGNSPQFVYGAAGTLTPLTGSATAVAPTPPSPLPARSLPPRKRHHSCNR